MGIGFGKRRINVEVRLYQKFFDFGPGRHHFLCVGGIGGEGSGEINFFGIKTERIIADFGSETFLQKMDKLRLILDPLFPNSFFVNFCI